MMVVSHGGDSVESLTPPTECFAYNFLLATPYDDLDMKTEIVRTGCYERQEMLFI